MTCLSNVVSGAILFGVAAVAVAQNPREIPVYPGAQLAEGEECCQFTTRDPLARVLSFYESRLHTKALTAQEYAARYPAMRARTEQLQQMMPALMQYRVFVPGEVSQGAQPGAEVFEVTSSPEGTGFSLTEEQLGVSGAQWGIEFRKKADRMTDADREYVSWVEQHPPARQEDYDLPVYPGALVDRGSGEAVSRRCYEAMLVTTDPSEKVVAFYQQKLLGQLKASVDNGKLGEPYRFGDERWQYIKPEEGPAEVHGRRGELNRYVDIYPPGHEEASWLQLPGQPYFSAEQREVVKGTPTNLVGIALKAQELTDACIQIAPNARWSNQPASQNMYTKEPSYVRPPQ